jgi:hypothetical protein
MAAQRGDDMRYIALIVQGTVLGLSSLSVYTSKVCSSSDVYDDNTH